MTTRFYNARILTMQQEEDVFFGEVIVKDDRIVEVRHTAKLASTPTSHEKYDSSIDCNGNLLMPGFKNAHTHSGMSPLRSLADDLPLQEWLHNSIFPREEKMTAEDIYYASQLSALEYLTSGITACMDMYLMPEPMEKAMDDIGMRCCQLAMLTVISHDVELLGQLLRKGQAPTSLQSYVFGFHAQYTADEEYLKEVSAAVHKYHAPVYCHACETEWEVKYSIDKYGVPPLVYLDSLGLFDYGGGIYHGVHVAEEELQIIKERGLYVVTCPASNLKLASGIAPTAEYLRRGIPLAIGTDGPASNNCLDFFREMFLVTGLAKVREHDPVAVDASEVLRMATVNGARAMHLVDCETLSAGQKADMIMLDLHQPNMQPLNNIQKNIVYSGSKLNVLMTMIDGRILYQNGKFADWIDVDGIYARVAAISARQI